MHSVKVTFKDDCQHHQLTVADGRNWRERETDDLGHRGARLGRDEGDQVEGENLIEMPIIRIICQYHAMGGELRTYVDDGFQGPEGGGDRRRQEELGRERLWSLRG